MATPTTPFGSPFGPPFGTPFQHPQTGVALNATLQAYVDFVKGEGGTIGNTQAMVNRYDEIATLGVWGDIAFFTDVSWGRSYTGGVQDGLYSLIRDTAALNTAFEPLFYFSAGPSPPAKRGQIFINETLANFGVGNADALVAMGYHIGFLNDSADAAHAYAVPSDSLRAALRGLGLDTVQKMIDRTVTIDLNTQAPALTGTMEGLHLLVSLTDSLLLHTNELAGSMLPELGNIPALLVLQAYGNEHTAWPVTTIPASVADSWRNIQVHNNLMATAATGVDPIITQVGISQQANPRTVASTLNVSGASMATPTWGTAAAPSDVAYSQRVLTYPGRNWTVHVQGAVDALVADLLPDLDYKYPLTAQHTSLTPAEVHLTTTDGSARLYHDTIDLKPYASGANDYILACYDSNGYAAFAFGGDEYAAEDGVDLVDSEGGSTRNMVFVDTAFDDDDIVKINIHEVV